MALQETQAARHPLGHHSHTWKCKESGCPVEFPILEGFGEAAVLFHRMHHTLLGMADTIAAQRDELVERDRRVRAEYERGHREGFVKGYEDARRTFFPEVRCTG